MDAEEEEEEEEEEEPPSPEEVASRMPSMVMSIRVMSIFPHGHLPPLVRLRLQPPPGPPVSTSCDSSTLPKLEEGHFTFTGRANVGHKTGGMVDPGHPVGIPRRSMELVCLPIRPGVV